MISFCLAIHTGLRRIDSFLRPVQMIRLDQRNLRVQRYYAPPQTLAYSYGNYDFMCQLCRYHYGPNSCSLYCSHPYPRQPPNLGVGGLRSTI